MSRVLQAWDAVVFLPSDLGHQKFGGLFLSISGGVGGERKLRLPASDAAIEVRAEAQMRSLRSKARLALRKAGLNKHRVENIALPSPLPTTMDD
jgi:hypothetical protein